MENLTGKQLGLYQVVEPIGEGGMAAVFKAYQPGMDRYVALKVLPRQLAKDPQFIARFQQEARVLAKLQHPHILPVFDFGESEGYTFLTMPFIDSGTLKELLEKQQALPVRQIRNIISQIGDALDYAHTQGLVHRDVKPSNILVDKRGNCLLTDFGIAKIVESTAHLTSTGGVVGTPVYMSPEQGRGAQIDARSDIYSLGVILFEMATGRVPYDAETPVAIIFKHVSDPLPIPSIINPQIPEQIERVILKSLAKDPDDRFQTARAMVDALNNEVDAKSETRVSEPLLQPTAQPKVQHETLVGSEPTVVARKPQRRLWLWGAAALGVVVIVGLVFAGLQLFKGSATALPETTSVAEVANPSPSVLLSQTSKSSATIGATKTVRPTQTASPTLQTDLPGVLVAPNELLVGQLLRSNNNRYVLRLQSDGDLVLFDRDQSKSLWAANTKGKQTDHLVMQSDGNLVLYTQSGQPIWESDTASDLGDYYLNMQDDGNLVIYRGTFWGTDFVAIWATNTSQ